MGILNLQVFLSLCMGGFLGSIAGWTLRRWLHWERTQAMEAAWRQDRSLLEERLSASAAAVRAEQGRVVQYSTLLYSSRSALRQKEGMCSAAKAEALALQAAVTECDAALMARTRELAAERTDLQNARKQISELKASLTAKEQRIAELEIVVSKPPESKPPEPKLLESPLPTLTGQNYQPFSQFSRELSLEPGDDLTQIHGIGPVFEKMLNGLGIRYYSQIAAWTDKDVEQVTARLPGVRNRIARDRWIERARQQNEKEYGRTLRRMAS